MIFESSSFVSGYPIINTLNTFTNFGVVSGVPFLFNGSLFRFQDINTGIPQILGIAINIYPFIDRLTYFQAIWGLNAYQNINDFVVKKSDLPNLTSKIINSPTALLIGTINNLLKNFPIPESVPLQASIFSNYPEGDYEYTDIVIRISKPLITINSEIQYPDNPFEPDLFTM